MPPRTHRFHCVHQIHETFIKLMNQPGIETNGTQMPRQFQFLDTWIDDDVRRCSSISFQSEAFFSFLIDKHQSQENKLTGFTWIILWRKLFLCRYFKSKKSIFVNNFSRHMSASILWHVTIVEKNHSKWFCWDKSLDFDLRWRSHQREINIFSFHKLDCSSQANIQKKVQHLNIMTVETI